MSENAEAFWIVKLTQKLEREEAATADDEAVIAKSW